MAAFHDSLLLMSKMCALCQCTHVCLLYPQVKSDYEAFYTDALRYLGCVDIAEIPGTYMYVCAACVLGLNW